MTEDMIELKVERMTDILDARLMTGVLTQQRYDAAMRELAQWADNQYAKLRR